MKRYYFKLIIKNLKWLAERAKKEHRDFFVRRPHLQSTYHKSLVGIVLCQGAALHYINQKNGIKDFDIWLFYKTNRKVHLSVRKPFTDKKGYNGIKIDFMKRVISASLCKKFFNRPDECILRHLQEYNTPTKRLLLQKAVIGLYPKKIFAKIIWPTKNNIKFIQASHR